MKRLSKEQVLMLHSQLIDCTGGINGVRDFNLLESAIIDCRCRQCQGELERNCK